MSEIVNEPLKKAEKGTAIAFVCMLIYGIFDFISRVLIARNVSQDEYGIFSIAFTFLNLFTILDCLGLQGGVLGYIAFFRGKGEKGKARDVIFASLQLSLIASLFCSFLLFLFADFFAEICHWIVSEY